MSKKRSIEETFQAVKPKGRRGIPNPPTTAVGVSSDNNDLASSLSEAGQQISQLQAAYQQQAALISANTDALQSNTSGQSGHSVAGAIGSVASGLLGGGLGLLSPLISGIASLFGGSSQPAALPIYTPPPPVAISATVSSPATPAASGTGAPASSSSSHAAAQVTVNVNAMDSQSFLDHSNDIANAVRQAMLNSHPINDVVANL